MKHLTDTSPEAQRVLTGIFRAMPPERKLHLQVEEYRLARTLHEAGLRRRNPNATRADVQDSWNGMMLGTDLWRAIKRDVPMNRDAESLAVIREVAAALTSLGIAYALGGSWASSLYGEPRLTRDADIAVDPFPGKEEALVGCFGADYYVSLDAVKQAVKERSTFNIIHFASGFKVDVFVQGDDAFAHAIMERRAPIGSPNEAGEPLMMVSAEDIILLKLRGYRLGGEVSDSQWSDVLGVLRTQSGRLNDEYLLRWAIELGVNDLLDRSVREA